MVVVWEGQGLLEAWRELKRGRETVEGTEEVLEGHEGC